MLHMKSMTRSLGVWIHVEYLRLNDRLQSKNDQNFGRGKAWVGDVPIQTLGYLFFGCEQPGVALTCRQLLEGSTKIFPPMFLDVAQRAAARIGTWLTPDLFWDGSAPTFLSHLDLHTLDFINCVSFAQVVSDPFVNDSRIPSEQHSLSSGGSFALAPAWIARVLQVPFRSPSISIPWLMITLEL